MEVEVFGMAGIPEGAVPGGPPPDGAQPSILHDIASHACIWLLAVPDDWQCFCMRVLPLLAWGSHQRPSSIKRLFHLSAHALYISRHDSFSPLLCHAELATAEAAAGEEPVTKLLKAVPGQPTTVPPPGMQLPGFPPPSMAMPIQLQYIPPPMYAPDPPLLAGIMF